MPLKTNRLIWKVSMQSVTFRIIFGGVKKRKVQKTLFPIWDQSRFLGNRPPTPPLSHDFALSQ